MGAWIEITDDPSAVITILLSLPVWERGLKFHNNPSFYHIILSLPVWERGLK